MVGSDRASTATSEFNRFTHIAWILLFDRQTITVSSIRKMCDTERGKGLDFNDTVCWHFNDVFLILQTNVWRSAVFNEPDRTNISRWKDQNN